jgi:hypothetical protein
LRFWLVEIFIYLIRNDTENNGRKWGLCFCDGNTYMLVHLLIILSTRYTFKFDSDLKYSFPFIWRTYEQLEIYKYLYKSKSQSSNLLCDVDWRSLWIFYEVHATKSVLLAFEKNTCISLREQVILIEFTKHNSIGSGLIDYK